ncbi:MAG: hypothetical protein JWO86_8352 [Myxococcaceae bacterium]|nr:hypothetical protein [Myxococcaceae bacterium]
MFRRTVSLLLFVSAASAATSAARIARAGGAQEQQLAQALFDEARRLMDRKRYGEACPKLAESQRLDPGGGTLLNLAICHEKEGKLATAKNDYDEALAVAVKDGRKDRQLIARERLAALEKSVPRISVVVPLSSDTEGLEVKLDGLVLRHAAWGVATPVDPGAHVIEVTAPSRTPWTTSIVVEAAQKKSVDVPALALIPTLPPQVGATSTPPEGASPVVVLGAGEPPEVFVEPNPADAPTLGPARPKHANPVFYTALAVTLVSGGASAVTGVLALGAKSDARSAGCVPSRNYCPNQAAYDTASRATSMAWVSTVTLGVAVAGAITMLAVPSRVANKPTVRAAVIPGAGSLEISGTF